MRGSALIKHYFGKDPSGMEDEEWSQLVAEAQYIAQFNALLTVREFEKMLVRTGFLKEK